MIGLGRHLNDDRLHEHYLAERSGEGREPRTADHLDECADCNARFLELAALMDDVRTTAELDLEIAFPAARLEEQRASILRRLEQVSRPARVLSFPHQVAQIASASKRTTARWLVASAAAGLLVGVGLGSMLMAPGRLAGDLTARFSAPPPRAAAPAPRPAVSLPAKVNEPLDDDRFLAELEIALQRRTTRELLPFDEWTPHVREVGSRFR